VTLEERLEELCQEWYAEKGTDTPFGQGFAEASRLCASELRAAVAQSYADGFEA
jgi:hypothetical protein